MNKRGIKIFFFSFALSFTAVYVPPLMPKVRGESEVADISFVRRELVNHITMAIKSIKKIPEDVVTGDEKRALEEYLMSLHDKFDAHQIDAHKITVIINWYYKNILFNYLQSGAVHEVRIHMGLFIEYLKTIKAIEDLTTKQMEDEFEKNAVVERDLLRKKIVALERRLGWINDDAPESKKAKLRRYMIMASLLIASGLAAAIVYYLYSKQDASDSQPSLKPARQKTLKRSPLPSGVPRVREESDGIKKSSDDKSPKSSDSQADETDNQPQCIVPKPVIPDEELREIQLSFFNDSLQGNEKIKRMLKSSIDSFEEDENVFVSDLEKPMIRREIYKLVASFVDQSMTQATQETTTQTTPEEGIVKRSFAQGGIALVAGVGLGSFFLSAVPLAIVSAVGGGALYKYLEKQSSQDKQKILCPDVEGLAEKLRLLKESYKVDNPQVAHFVKKSFESQLNSLLSRKRLSRHEVSAEEEHQDMNGLRKLLRELCRTKGVKSVGDLNKSEILNFLNDNLASIAGQAAEAAFARQNKKKSPVPTLSSAKKDAKPLQSNKKPEGGQSK